MHGPSFTLFPLWKVHNCVFNDWNLKLVMVAMNLKFTIQVTIAWKLDRSR